MKPISAYYSLPKLAILLDHSTQWIRKEIKDGHFEAVYIGGRMCVEAGSVNRYLATHKVMPRHLEKEDL